MNDSKRRITISVYWPGVIIGCMLIGIIILTISFFIREAKDPGDIKWSERVADSVDVGMNDRVNERMEVLKEDSLLCDSLTENMRIDLDMLREEREIEECKDSARMMFLKVLKAEYSKEIGPDGFLKADFDIKRGENYVFLVVKFGNSFPFDVSNEALRKSFEPLFEGMLSIGFDAIEFRKGNDFHCCLIEYYVGKEGK